MENQMCEITFSKNATVKNALYEAQKHCINSLMLYARPEFAKLQKWERAKTNNDNLEVDHECAYATPGEIEYVTDKIMNIHGRGRVSECATERDELVRFFTDAYNLAEAIVGTNSGKFHVHFQVITNHDKNLKVEWQMKFQVNGKTIIAFTATSRCLMMVGPNIHNSHIQGINFEYHKTWMPVGI